MDERLTELSRFGLQKNANGKQQSKAVIFLFLASFPRQTPFDFPLYQKGCFNACIDPAC